MDRQRKQPLPNDEDLGPFPAALAQHSGTKRGKHSEIIWLAVVGIAILLVAVGSLLFYLMHHHDSRSTTGHPNIPAVQASTHAPSQTTTQYISNGKDLNLSFRYPSDWTVTPPSKTNSNDRPIILTSPFESLASSSTGTTTGKLVVTFRPGTAQISELASGSVTIAQNSMQIAYSHPTASQQQYPYLTFIHLSGGQNPSGVFEEVMLTGVTQFSKDQPITSDSLGQLDPIVSASFYRCTSKDCSGSGGTPLSITNNIWQNSSSFEEIQSLFQSLQFH